MRVIERYDMTVGLMAYPTAKDWMEVKRRALVTIGKTPVTEPDEKWKRDMLECRHSPIRYLRFSFWLEIPYWVSVHLVRHRIDCQPYVSTQRDDRQSVYARGEAPQNAMIKMIWDVGGEELLNIANKRLCSQASPETRQVVGMMCELVADACPEFKDELVPACVRNGGVCHELHPCGRAKKEAEHE